MSDLLSNHNEASAWVKQQKAIHSSNSIFGKIASAVIWTGMKGLEEESLVPASPQKLADEINTKGMPLFRAHDPGAPQGRVIAAKIFEGADNALFVAAILGLYSGGKHLRFEDFGFNPEEVLSAPSSLPALSNGWIEFATDSREVDPAWVDDVLKDAPISAHKVELSHNAAESSHELISIGLAYVAIVWNPFVTAVAKEAGKDAYGALHQWLRKFWEKLAERNNSIINIQSEQSGCAVSFLIRGNDVQRNYAAHDALSGAAVQAAQLIQNMKNRGAVPSKLVYEFDPQGKWFPSYAELADGQFVNSKNILIALEQLPSGLSLGLRRDKNM